MFQSSLFFSFSLNVSVLGSFLFSFYFVLWCWMDMVSSFVLLNLEEEEGRWKGKVKEGLKEDKERKEGRIEGRQKGK